MGITQIKCQEKVLKLIGLIALTKLNVYIKLPDIVVTLKYNCSKFSKINVTVCEFQMSYVFSVCSCKHMVQFLVCIEVNMS